MNKEFLDKDFLLDTETAKHLYHDYAAKMPIIDYHCHIPPKEIYENRRFDDLAQVWLGGKNPDGLYFGDHYKWRLMRSAGISEEYITGNKGGFERFEAFVGALELAIGNPMYHWCNLELQRFFGVKTPLSKATAKEIWKTCNSKLQNDNSLTAQGIIQRSNVAMIGTTDDPVDTLEWHEKIKADNSIDFAVYPSFRPDKAINIHKTGFAEYIAQLAASVGKEGLSSADEVCRALSKRLEFFAEMGCKASDHGLGYIMFRPCSDAQANFAFQKAMAGEPLTLEEAEGYQTKILLHLSREYHRLNIAMQLHYSCTRDTNEKMFRRLGPDSGFDTIAQTDSGNSLIALLSTLDTDNQCPKTVLYSLNPTDNALLGSIIGSFQSDEIPGKIQHGSAWWFNDTKTGMIEHMTSLANLGVLGNFIGMLTDSRSFLSYTRHEYFRRILCNLIGNWVKNGEYPNDDAALKRIVEGICYNNAARYFGLDRKINVM